MSGRGIQQGVDRAGEGGPLTALLLPNPLTARREPAIAATRNVANLDRPRKLSGGRRVTIARTATQMFPDEHLGVTRCAHSPDTLHYNVSSFVNHDPSPDCSHPAPVGMCLMHCTAMYYRSSKPWGVRQTYIYASEFHTARTICGGVLSHRRLLGVGLCGALTA